MNALIQALSGRKTYVLVAAAVLWVLSDGNFTLEGGTFANPGSSDLTQILQALMVGTLRAGVAKSQNGKPKAAR